MKKPLGILLSLALGAGGIFFYQRSSAVPSDKRSPSPQNALVAKAEKRDLDISVEVSGDVAPFFQLDVKPEVGGKLKAVHIEPGAIVKEGAPLVEIDDTDLLTERETALTEIEGAKLQVERDQRNFVRGKELFDSKLISREAYDNLASTVALSENALTKSSRRAQIVEDRLRKTKVLAPCDGTVLSVPVTEGQVVIGAASVNSGTTLMTIANLSKLLVETHINQIDVARIQPNQKVKLHAESLRQTEMEATISFIAPIATVKNTIKGFQVQAVINAPVAQLRPGMTVQLKILIDHAQDALTVPISGIFKGDGNSKVVYVRNGEGSEKRAVKVGLISFEHAQILNGLKEGEEILLVEPGRDRAKKS